MKRAELEATGAAKEYPMKAVILTEYGGPEVLKVRDFSVPAPARTQ